jgi:hypothetical protein
MPTVERFGESAERADSIRRDLANPELSLREVARRNGTSHSQVMRVRDEDVEVQPAWRRPRWAIPGAMRSPTLSAADRLTEAECVAFRRADIADLEVRDIDELVREVERLTVERDEYRTLAEQLLADCAEPSR